MAPVKLLYLQLIREQLCVRPFAAAAEGDRRVSIVLESYVLPRLDIWRARRLVPTFQIG